MGHYSVGLLWKNENTKLPYNTQIEVSRKEIVNYLPHHRVKNFNKLGKISVDFDAGAKCKNTLLNENLLKGPDYLSKFISILIKFRKERFAVMGNIKEMHHQMISYLKNDDTNFGVIYEIRQSTDPDNRLHQNRTKPC